MRLLSAVTAALLLAACVGEPPSLEPEEDVQATEPAAASETEADPAAETETEELARTEEELHDFVATLIAENGQLKLDLMEMEADRDRYRDGLAKAVEELNRISSQQAQVNRYVPPPSRPSRSTRATARVSTLGAPRVQLLGDKVVVTGRVYNSGDGDARGSVVLNLMVDGQSVDDARVPLDVPARTDQVYSYTFFNPGSNGTYSARIRLDYP